MQVAMGLKGGDDRAETYRRAAAGSDLDALHDVIARVGPEVLDRGVPYVVVAARNRRADRLRRERHFPQIPLSTIEAVEPESRDPSAQVVAKVRLEELVSALAELGDRDLSILWWSADGMGDDDIAARLVAMGFDTQMASAVSIRKRRQRARRRVLSLLGSR